MISLGIVDPLKVISRALANAVSVAGLLFTADYAVILEQDDSVELFKKLLNENKQNG
jgi:chaperonin GroEL (HSP60 family)